MTKDLLPSASPKGLFAPLTGRSRPRPVASARCDPRAGQAYTEYLVILGFGVLLAFGMVIGGTNQDSVVNRLYGYMFDYYASLANFLNLPFL